LSKKVKKIIVSGFPESYPPHPTWCIEISPEEQRLLKKRDNRRNFTDSYLAKLVAGKQEVACEKISCVQIIGTAPEGTALGIVSTNVEMKPQAKDKKKTKEEPVPRGFCDPSYYLGQSSA